MSTLPAFNYNPALGIIQGFSDDGPTKVKLCVGDAADHLFVIYLRGVSSSWKQPIGCITLKNGPNTDFLRDIVMQALSAAHAQGKWELPVKFWGYMYSSYSSLPPGGSHGPRLRNSGLKKKVECCCPHGLTFIQIAFDFCVRFLCTF